MSEKQKEFIEGIKDLNKYSFDIIDKTLIEDTNIEAVLPCNKCDGDCCGIVPFKHEHIIHIFNKYTDSKKCSKDVFSTFKKRFPYSSETSLKKNLEFKAFMGELDSIVVEFKDKNKFKKMGFGKVDCIFKKDPKSGGCLIYEDRPLICRAYGKKKSLQCPYSGLNEQPKDEAIKKSKIMTNNGRMLDSIDEMTIKNRI